ncbi:MAG: T9SS type A sorting domain-containing protein [Flavobacteriales bacterium]
MRRTLLALSLSFAASLPAQIIIGEDDMPAVNDTLRFRSTVAVGIDVDFTGAGVTWDMSALLPQVEGADTTVSVGSTPFLYQFYFNNPFLYPQNRADYGVVGVDFNVQAFSLSDVYDYFRADDVGFFNVGFGANVNGLPTSVRRSPIDRIYAFPLEFGDTDVSTSAFNVNVPTVLYFGQDQVRTTEVDGWGTLILPADTFEVLRVKSTLQRTDTIYVEQLGFGFRLPEPETIEYKWLAAGMGKPVLEVTSIAGVAASAEFYYDPEDVITGVNTSARAALQVYPNPAHAEIFVQLDTHATGTLVLRDIAGRPVLERPIRSGALQRLDVAALAQGTYVIEHSAGDRIARSTVIID